MIIVKYCKKKIQARTEILHDFDLGICKGIWKNIFYYLQ